MNATDIQNLSKTIRDTGALIKAYKEKKTVKNETLTKKQIEEMIKSQMATVKNTDDVQIVRKGEFDSVTLDDKGGLNSYRFAMLHKSSDPTVIELQNLNDDLLILGAVMSHMNKTSYKDAVINSSLYKKFSTHTGVSELRKAIDGTSGKGLEWIPTLFSATLMEKVKIELKVAALFGRINMPSNPYVLPVEAADAVGYLVANTSSDDIRDSNAMPLASTPGTSKTTFNAAKLGARTVFNEETSEDSIISVMEYVKTKVVEAIARAIENATCNGSTATVHPDFDIENDANSAKLSDRAWNGFRQCIQDATTWSSGATFNLAAIRAARKLMGKYGIYPNDLAIICSVNVWYHFMNSTNFPEIQTLDKYGPNALILTGEVGKIDGISIIVSEFVRDTVSANGFNVTGGPNNLSSLSIVNRKCYLYGDRREITTDSERNIETDKTVIVSKIRMDFERLFATTEKCIGGLYNITP